MLMRAKTRRRTADPAVAGRKRQLGRPSALAISIYEARRPSEIEAHLLVAMEATGKDQGDLVVAAFEDIVAKPAFRGRTIDGRPRSASVSFVVRVFLRYQVSREISSI
ncbi:hypothetical protein [Bradyrhizobium ottawaense]|uniref:hypothetical protein n=1 Tax=Bradyrhizobium ottawaense TaxID=931866 RepID=UPI003FA1159A